MITNTSETEHRVSKDLSELVARNYLEIARRDLVSSLQNTSELQKIALSDARAIGFTSGKKVLEIGPGHGFLLKHLREHGATIFAADIVDTYLNRIATFTEEIAVFDIQDPHGPPGHWFGLFDLIVMTDVLEHLTHPQDALLVCLSLLAPKGQLYVRVPAHESLVNYSRVLGRPYPLVHLRTYDRRALKRELISCGYSLKKGPRHSRKGSRQPGWFLSNSKWYAKRNRQGLAETYVRHQDHEIDSRRVESAKYVNSQDKLVRFAKRCLMRLLTKKGELWALASRAD